MISMQESRRKTAAGDWWAAPDSVPVTGRTRRTFRVKRFTQFAPEGSASRARRATPALGLHRCHQAVRKAMAIAAAAQRHRILLRNGERGPLQQGGGSPVPGVRSSVASLLATPGID